MYTSKTTFVVLIVAILLFQLFFYLNLRESIADRIEIIAYQMGVDLALALMIMNAEREHDGLPPLENTVDDTK